MMQRTTYHYLDIVLSLFPMGLCIYMKNQLYHFPTYMLYAYSVKEPIGELNLKRALDENIGVLFPSFIFFSTGSDSRFWEFHPSSVILGVFVFSLSLSYVLV